MELVRILSALGDQVLNILSIRPPVQIQVCGCRLARLRKMYEETTCPRTGRGATGFAFS
jgi:hypothetical protein